MPYDLDAQIDAWRGLLLDTTKRNRLVNFKTGRGGGIPLVHPDPGDLWHRLVATNKALVLPRKGELIDLPEAPAAEAAPTLFDPDKTPEPKPDLGELERCRCSPRLRPEHVLTDLADDRLGPRLTRLHLASREALSEQGVAVLFVVFGFLRWFESPDSDVELRAPLLLVPARLERESVDASWRLQADEDEILPNHTLAQLLANDFRLTLPLPDDAGDPDSPAWRTAYLAAVEQAVRQQPRWEVLDEAALGIFRFQKLAMWDDLGRNRDRIKAHELCRAMAGDRSVALRQPADMPRETELDDRIQPAETHHVLDADSSQLAAVVSAGRGASLVLDGPPGTGKSQTIANIIAEALAAGKTVLFVSEKTAALEVVKRRLDKCRLGDFCLECHSTKANKRAVVEELGRSLDLAPESYRDSAGKLRQLQEVRQQLNAYVRALHAVQPSLGKSAFQVHGELAQLAGLDSKSRCPVPDVLGRDSAWLQHATDLLARLPDARAVLESGGKHPWRNCRAAVVSLTLRDDAQHHLARLAEGLPQAADAAEALHQLGFVQEHAARGEWLRAGDNARRALKSDAWWDAARRQELSDLVARFIENAAMAQQLRGELAKRMVPEAFAAETAALVYQAVGYRSAWKRLLPSWWTSLRGKVRAWYFYGDQPMTKSQIWDDLDKLARFHDCFAFCRRVREERQHDVLLDAEKRPDWEGTRKALLRVTALDKDGEAPPRDRLREAVEKIDALRRSGMHESWNFVTNQLFEPSAQISTGIVLNRSPLRVLGAWAAERAADVLRMQEWARYAEIERSAVAASVRPVLDEVANGQVKLAEAADAFRARFLRLWLDAVYEQVPTLRHFAGEQHERLIERFRELDRLSVASAPARIRDQLLTRPDRPRSSSGEAPGSSELGTLLREVHKKRRHLPLRRLFAALPNLLPRLKPCLMMSPLAVSTYLNSPDLHFDLVIFDEASQVRPHDAICAVYRGRQLVVAGDQKQLPPTDFFERALDDFDDESDDGGVADFESVLDVCCTLGLPRRRLRWHYRSRRESLIAFANHHIYGNELVTFPSTQDLRGSSAVAFDFVADGRWKSGTSGGYNTVEARQAAQRVLDHFRDNPDESLGVIAFSQRQQMCILDELEQFRRANPEYEEFFREDRDDPFFVKNLENVQGDERDVIFLSVGYGPDEAGKVAMRFGPLNRQGGERRLNVAVTRARRRMIVISSLRAADIDLTRTQAVGARLLRAYLDYAERGPEALRADITEAGTHGFDSPFEKEVYDELTRRGLTLHPQVGCSGYRIDLAVVDPRQPGRYLLGVECDGATYHSSATARDRDRLRQEVLESLGWRVYRVWSADWLRDRAGQVNHVLAALEQARREGAPAPRPAPEPPPARPVAPPAPLASPDYGSIERVPDDVLRHLVLTTLQTFGATAESELVLAVAKQLGFQRTGKRIQARLDEAIAELERAGHVARMADQRLQTADPIRAARG